MLRTLSVVILSLTLISAAGCLGGNAYIGKAAPRKQEKKYVFGYKLHNGLTVLVNTRDKSGPAAVQVWVADGSAGDPENKPGLAHFVEHMLFTGSKDLPPGTAEEMLEGMGGELNGSTGRDYSYVGVTLPGAGWKQAVEVLYKMTAAPAFSPEQIEDQRRVIALEIEQSGTEADSILMEYFFEEAYRIHPYRIPPEGMPGAVKGFTAEDAARYHRLVYVPSNMTLVVAGNVNPAEVRSTAEKTFGTLPAAARKRPKNGLEPSQISARERYIPMPVNAAYMAIGWRVCDTSDRDIYPLEVLRAVMGMGSGSRLAMELKERKALVMDIDAELFTFRDPGMFVVKASIKDSEDIKRAKEDILRQALKLKTELISDEELSRAVLGIETMQMLAMDTAEGQAYALGYWSTVFGGRNPGDYLDSIRSVTPEDVRRAAQTYLGEGNYTLSVVKPEKL